MPQQPDEEHRINRLRADLQDIGLVWRIHYRLIDHGERWGLEYVQPLTDAQYKQAEALLERDMNR